MKTKDKHKTKVEFLVNTHEGQEELFAFFPEEKYNQDPNLFNSYSHIGQHSACHIDYANESRDATPEERAELQKELEQIGYNLEILV